MLFYSHPNNKRSKGDLIETFTIELNIGMNKYSITYRAINVGYNGDTSAKSSLRNYLTFYKNYEQINSKYLITSQEMHPIVYHENGIVKYCLYEMGCLNIYHFNGELIKSFSTNFVGLGFYFMKSLSNEYSIIGFEELCSHTKFIYLIDNSKFFSFDGDNDDIFKHCRLNLLDTEIYDDYCVVGIDENLNITFIDDCFSNYTTYEDYYDSISIQNGKLKCLSLEEYENYVESKM